MDKHVEWIEARKCPHCGKFYTAAPAISRKDNQTPICPACGTLEALDELNISEEEKAKIMANVKEWESDLNNEKEKPEAQ